MNKKFNIISVIIFLFSSIICYSQWVQVGPSSGMTFNAIAIENSTIFIGARFNGVFTSTNNGQNWIQTPLNNQIINALAAGSNYVYAGTADANNGIYYTSNYGLNWFSSSVNNQLVNCIALQNSNIFVGTPMGVSRSTNNAQSWVQVSPAIGNVEALFIKDSLIFAGTSAYGVYLSSNNGQNWVQDGLNYLFVTSFTSYGSNIYAGTCSGPSPSLYTTTNNGGNWIVVDSLVMCMHVITFYNNVMITAAQSPGIFISTNNGQNWIQKNEGMGNLNIFSLLIANGYAFAGSENNGLWRRPISELIGITPISKEVPVEFKLYQNYPNPFNPSTKIKFSTPLNPPEGGTYVQLIIYDILGCKVSTLVNEKLSPGTYEVEWDASDYSSGVYFYKLEINNASSGDNTAGPISITKRMVLLK